MSLLSTNERVKVLAVRSFPGAFAATNEAGDRKQKVEHTHKCPTGFLPMEGVGHANHIIPLAAHLRSRFFATFVMLFAIKEILLCR